MAGKSSALSRRAKGFRFRAGAKVTEVKWFTKKVERILSLSMRERTRLAVKLVKNQVKINLSVPVAFKRRTYRKAGRFLQSKVVDPASRSRPGDFPRMETAQLIRSIRSDVHRLGKNDYEGSVYTVLEYGVLLETIYERSFLERTLRELKPVLATMMVRPIRIGAE